MPGKVTLQALRIFIFLPSTQGQARCPFFLSGKAAAVCNVLAALAP